MYKIIGLFIFISILISSCFISKVSNSKQTSEIVDHEINKIETTIEIQRNIFKKSFISDMGKIDLPNSSASAINIGYKIINKTEHIEQDSYEKRYGFDRTIICSNGKTEIKYWENDKESMIWSFESADPDLIIFGNNLVTLSVEEVIKMLGDTPEKNNKEIFYDHKDFGLHFYITDGIVIKVYLTNYI